MLPFFGAFLPLRLQTGIAMHQNQPRVEQQGPAKRRGAASLRRTSHTVLVGYKKTQAGLD